MRNGSQTKHIVVIGGGISGLSAAYYLQKHADEQNIKLSIQVIEESGVLGGKIQTIEKDGFIIEKGPDSFLARKQPIIKLSKELGLEAEFVGTNPNARANFIYFNKKLHPMPMGLVLGIPTKMTPFLKTGLISPFGKIRAAMDLVLPKRKGTDDESLGHFVERRLGKEVLEHITEPLLGGIYSGDARAISIKATFPHFLSLEQQHGSLIKGMMKSKPPMQDNQLPEAAKNSMFVTYKHGMRTLINRLTEAMPSVDMLTNCGVETIIHDEQQYILRLDSGLNVTADGLIMAVPATEAARLLPGISENRWLEKIRYVSVANIALAFDAEAIPSKLNGTGFVIPQKEGMDITACTWTSSKWLHAAPEGKVLLRCYVGNEHAQDWVQLTDEQLIRKVRYDLESIMGITAKPIFYELTRAIKAMPQYPVNHVEELANVRKELQLKMPGLFLCGAGYGGVGIPDCIQQGEDAAAEMMNYLKL